MKQEKDLPKLNPVDQTKDGEIPDEEITDKSQKPKNIPKNGEMARKSVGNDEKPSGINAQHDQKDAGQGLGKKVPSEPGIQMNFYFRMVKSGHSSLLPFKRVGAK